MAEHPKSGGEPRPAFELENCQDYTSALGMIAAARRLFLWLLVFSLMLQVGAYATARWRPAWITPQQAQSEAPDAVESADAPLEDGVVLADHADAGADAASTSQPADQTAPVATTTAEPTVGPITASRVRLAIEGLMPIASFAGVISCMLLMLCYLVALNLALSGRLGGVRGSLAGFLWMAVVLVLLLPWEQWLGPLGSPLSGVYSTAAQTLEVPQTFETGAAELAHYVRYLGYPILALMMVWVADRRYARGYRMACRQAEAWLHVRPI